MLEVQRLQLELARIDREIQRRARRASGDVSELAQRRAEVKREFDRAYEQVLEETGERQRLAVAVGYDAGALGRPGMYERVFVCSVRRMRDNAVHGSRCLWSGCWTKACRSRRSAGGSACTKRPSATGSRNTGSRRRNRDKHAARGALALEELERLVARGASIAQIAQAVGRSKATVRHWLDEYGLRTHANGLGRGVDARGRRRQGRAAQHLH